MEISVRTPFLSHAIACERVTYDDYEAFWLHSPAHGWAGVRKPIHSVNKGFRYLVLEGGVSGPLKKAANNCKLPNVSSLSSWWVVPKKK